MFIAFCTFAGDIDKLIEQLKWCAKLGPQKRHYAVIVADCSTDFFKVREARLIAAQIFQSAVIITNAEKVDGWIKGPKSLFLRAAEEAEKRQEPFLLMETDAIPLKPGWADAIADEYAACGKKYMGHIYTCTNVALPPKLMSGIGVYSPDTLGLKEMIELGANWDVAMTPGVLPHAHDTKLIFHLWGEYDRAPSFANEQQVGTNIFCLKQIPAEAVIWHRNKDGTLINMLHRQMFPEQRMRENISVVMPVCGKDINLAIQHARWLRMLTKKHWPHKAIVAFDKSLDMSLLTSLVGMLRSCFVEVEMFCHPQPPIEAWPQAPNWVFQNVAHKMNEQSRSWLWLEADAVVLRADWLEVLQFEYEGCGKSFMGPIVKGMGHVNGGSIYPPDTPARAPIAMRCMDRAWDYDMRPDMIHDCHDASHLMRHIWTVLNDEAIEVGGGEEPRNITADRARRWIPESAVMVHRIKDDSLTQLLMRGEVKR